MDLIGGRAVRLAQGRFDERQRLFATTLPTRSRQFEAAGATWAHVVDLDGARAGQPRPARSHRKLASAASLRTPGRRRIPRRASNSRGCSTRRRPDGRWQPGRQRARDGPGWLAEFGADRITLSLDVRLVEVKPDRRHRRLDRRQRQELMGRGRRLSRSAATAGHRHRPRRHAAGAQFRALSRNRRSDCPNSPSRRPAGSRRSMISGALRHRRARSSARRCGRAGSALEEALGLARA